MIKIRDLEFRYREGDFRLQIPDLQLQGGEAIAIIGPSGTGKTTLLNLMSGVCVPDSGTITVNDVEVSSLDDGPRRDFRLVNIGLVFQEFELLAYLKVLDNILLPYRINPALRLDTSVVERARGLSREVGVGDKLGRHPDHLSQGERQRVAVCRALLTQPTVIFADEPTGNLDPSNKGRVLDILFDYGRKSGATMVTVTHDHDLLERFDRVVDFRRYCDGGNGMGSPAPDPDGGGTAT